MRVVAVSCLAYQDAWNPFRQLFGKFWPDCPYPLDFATDEDRPGLPWGEVVARYAANQHEPVLLLQEDFFLNAPVNTDLIEYSLDQMALRGAAAVRLYPCPGADTHYGSPLVGSIQPGSAYRVSCQATIWSPAFLRDLAIQCTSPSQFEIRGTHLSKNYREPFLAWWREAEPWPIQYICSAISRGKWNPQALEFCKQHGIEIHSTREVACK